MHELDRYIEELRKIEAERELTESEEKRLVSLLKCKSSDNRPKTRDLPLSDPRNQMNPLWFL